MSRSIPRLPEVGDGTLAILRRAGIRTALDLVRNRDGLRALPGIGPAREAVLLEWAERMLSEDDLIVLLGESHLGSSLNWVATMAERNLLDDAKKRFNYRLWDKVATEHWDSLKGLRRLDEQAETSLPLAERKRLRARIRPRLGELVEDQRRGMIVAFVLLALAAVVGGIIYALTN